MKHGLDQALEKTRADGLDDDAWKTMQKNAWNMIRLVLAPEIKYNLLKEEMPTESSTKLEKIYLSKSLTYRLCSKMELCSFNSG